MSAVTFGDFLHQANGHLAAAAACSQSETTDPATVARELRRVVRAMARHVEDHVPVSAAGVAGGADLRPWERAVVGACTALHKADDCLNLSTGTARGRSQRREEGVAGCLAAAATSLVVGRDLLHTHVTTDPDDLWEDRSEWSAVVASAPATKALLGEVARWSRQLALVAAGLVSASPVDSQEGTVTHGALQGTAAWLWEAAAAITPAQVVEPVTADDRILLHAIPAADRPGRLVPSGHESVAMLCAGITISAQRLRAVEFGAAGRPRWASATADGWRWTATAAAVTGHASELLLRSLSGHPGQISSLPLDGTHLHTAIDAVRRSWMAWRQVAGAWAGVTTEMRGRSSPVVTEIGDLVLRMGRLAWDDPQWIPERARGSGLRTVTGLTVGGDGITAVVAAVHQAADALARVAAADRAAVATTDGAGHLYVRTRSLPEGYDVPRRYATAPAERTRPLLEAYQAAEEASSQAASALATLALVTEAPSSTLALARAATASRLHNLDQNPAAAAAASVDRPAARQPRPGPVEQAIRKKQVEDPGVLLRAAVIDDAAQQLIAQAEQLSGQPSPRSAAVTARRRHPGSPATLAAKDSPLGPTSALTSRAGISTRPEAGRNPQSRPAPRPGRRHGQGSRSGRTPLWKTPEVFAAAGTLWVKV